MSSPEKHFDALDRGNGNGARTSSEDWLDLNTTAAENQWSTASTTFRYWESPPGEEQRYKDLYDAHHGWGSSGRRTELRRSRILADAQMFCSVCDLPRQQRNRIRSIVEGFDFSSQRFGGKPYEKILLSIISLVNDSAVSSGESPSFEDRIVVSDEFQSLRETVDLDAQEMNRLRKKLRAESDYF